MKLCGDSRLRLSVRAKLEGFCALLLLDRGAHCSHDSIETTGLPSHLIPACHLHTLRSESEPTAPPPTEPGSATLPNTKEILRALDSEAAALGYMRGVIRAQKAFNSNTDTTPPRSPSSSLRIVHQAHGQSQPGRLHRRIQRKKGSYDSHHDAQRSRRHAPLLLRRG